MVSLENGAKQPFIERRPYRGECATTCDIFFGFSDSVDELCPVAVISRWIDRDPGLTPPQLNASMGPLGEGGLK